jgi:hypothetical protein
LLIGATPKLVRLDTSDFSTRPLFLSLPEATPGMRTTSAEADQRRAGADKRPSILCDYRTHGTRAATVAFLTRGKLADT